MLRTRRLNRHIDKDTVADKIVAVKADAKFRETLKQLTDDFEYRNASEVIYEAVYALANLSGVGNPFAKGPHPLLIPPRRTAESEVGSLISSVSSIQTISCAIS